MESGKLSQSSQHCLTVAPVLPGPTPNSWPHCQMEGDAEKDSSQLCSGGISPFGGTHIPKMTYIYSYINMSLSKESWQILANLRSLWLRNSAWHLFWAPSIRINGYHGYEDPTCEEKEDHDHQHGHHQQQTAGRGGMAKPQKAWDESGEILGRWIGKHKIDQFLCFEVSTRLPKNPKVSKVTSEILCTCIYQWFS